MLQEINDANHHVEWHTNRQSYYFKSTTRNTINFVYSRSKDIPDKSPQMKPDSLVMVKI